MRFALIHKGDATKREVCLLFRTTARTLARDPTLFPRNIGFRKTRMLYYYSFIHICEHRVSKDVQYKFLKAPLECVRPTPSLIRVLSSAHLA